MRNVTVPAPLAPNAVVVTAALAPPVTVFNSVLPRGLLLEVTLPSNAFEVLSPAETWNAELLELKARWLPLASVTMEAVTPAFLNAVADCVVPFPAFSMAVLMAATRVVVSVTPDRLTETLTRLASENPDPRK